MLVSDVQQHESALCIHIWASQVAHWVKNHLRCRRQTETVSVPRSGRSHGRRHGKPLQYSCLENPRDRGAWQATDHGVTKSQIRLKQQSVHTHIYPLPLEPPSSHPSRSTQSAKLSCLCRVAASHQLWWCMYIDAIPSPSPTPFQRKGCSTKHSTV